MKIAAFPDWLRRFRERANELPYCARLQAPFDALLGIETDGALCVSEVVGGRIGPFRPASEEERPTFTVYGTADDWSKVVYGEVSYAQATSLSQGILKYRGDLTAYFQNLGALCRAMDTLPEARPVRKLVESAWDASLITGRYVTVDGMLVHVEEAGEGPTIVLLHSGGGDTRQWLGLMSLLADRYRLVTFDWPGHGKSWPLARGKLLQSPAEFTAFYLRLHQILDLQRPVIAGQSLGANIAIDIVQSKPELFNSLISLGGAAHTPTTSNAMIEYMNHPHVNLPDMSEPQAMSGIGLSTDQLGYEMLHWSIRQRCSDSYQADVGTYVKFDLREGMGRVTCPALFARGQSDWLVAENRVRETARLAPNATFLSLPGVGHFMATEAPDMLATKIHTFLTEGTP